MQTVFCLFTLVLAELITALPAQSPSSSLPFPPTITNPETGVAFQGNLSSGVESYLNIRFAQDTSGSNRFALPKPFHYPQQTVVNASKPGAACPQAVTTGDFATKIDEMSEDCLTLRIDRLQNTTADSNLPVMIYFYGGGYTSGQIYDPVYDPTGLLKSAAANGSPIIYAAVKLGLFGFASSSALAANNSLNAGLYDQRLGMEWIKSHIHLFGGDPRNVTIFGQSAGAISVGHHINAFGGTKPAPFHRAIMQSGMSTSVSGTTGDICTNHTSAVAQLLNCTSPDSGTQLDCLRAVPYTTLLPVVSKYELSINANALLIWQPISPSPFIPDAPSKLLRSGRFAKNIDIINGWNENDGSEFVRTSLITDAEVIQNVTSPAALDNATATELLSLYPLSSYAPEQSGNNTATAQFFRASQMYRDTVFLCPSLLLSSIMTTHSPSIFHTPRISSSLFTMNATLFAPIFEIENTTFLGVAHGGDIPFVFDTVPSYNTSTSEQKQLASGMAASWAAFASSGDPVAGKVALKGWDEAMGESYNGGGNEGEFQTRVLGGPNDGMARIGSDGLSPLASEDVIRRCAFWNDQRVLDQLQK